MLSYTFKVLGVIYAPCRPIRVKGEDFATKAASQKETKRNIYQLELANIQH